MAGLIKAILVLKHRVLPGNLHFSSLNPNIKLGSFDAVFPVESEDLSDYDKDLSVGVSSFGFSGSNAHVILSEVPADHDMPQICGDVGQPSPELKYKRIRIPMPTNPSVARPGNNSWLHEATWQLWDPSSTTDVSTAESRNVLIVNGNGASSSQAGIAEVDMATLPRSHHPVSSSARPIPSTVRPS